MMLYELLMLLAYSAFILRFHIFFFSKHCGLIYFHTFMGILCHHVAFLVYLSVLYILNF